MNKNFFKLFAAASVATLMTACGGSSSIGGFGKLAMDSEEAVTKVKEIVTENVDPKEWKLIQLEWDEGSGNTAELENNLKNGSVFTKLVKSNGQVFTQSFMGQLGWKATEISPDHWYDKGLDYEKITPIDASKLDPATVMKQLNDAKKMIPAEYEFKSLASYRIEAGVPARRDGTDYSEQQTTEFTFNVVEKGNETVSNAGTTSIIYYEIQFEVQPDGTIVMKE